MFPRLLCFLVALVVGDVHGASITYDFSGSLNKVSGSLTPDLAVNDGFEGSFSVNGTNQSSRRHRDIIDGRISVGGIDYQFTDYDLFLRNGTYLDQYWIFNGSFGNGGISGPSINGRAVSDVQFIFSDWRGSDGSFWSNPDGVEGLTSDQLLQLSLFDSARIVLRFGYSFAKGNISNLAVTPLPAAIWFFLLGIGALFGRKFYASKN